MNRLSFWRLLASAIFLGMLLSGCASIDRPMPANEIVLAPGQGVAILQLTSNGRTSELFSKWGQLRVRNAATGDDRLAFDVLGSKSHKSLFVIALPEGDYYLDELHNLDVMSLGSVSVPGSKATINVTNKNEATARLGKVFGKFSVRAGKVTNLGMMAFARPKPGKYSEFYLDFLPAKAELDRALKLLDPQVAAAARSGIIDWTPEGNSWRSVWMPERAYGLSFYVNGPTRAKDGSLYFGEAYGQIARRDSSGKWAWSRTGGNSPILCTAILDDGSLLAGSEHGAVFFKAATGGTWKTIPFPLENAFIRHLDYLPAVGYVVVAHDRDDVHVMASPSLENPNWSELAKLAANPRAIAPPDVSPVKVWRRGEKLVVGTHAPFDGFSRQVMLHEFDSTTKTWRAISVKQGFHSLDSLNVSADGTLIGLSAALGFQNSSISSDGGVTWAQRTSPNWLLAADFRGPETGFALRKDSMISGTSSLWTTTDGAESWKKVGAVPENAARLVLLDQSREMLLVTMQNQIYASRDSGMTWTLDR